VRSNTPFAATLLGIAIASLGVARPALAQRTDDNVTAQSDDAFGRSVGNESLGIYAPYEVRGFSPIDAGNVRMEGLYFDRQTDPSNRLVEGSAIRVGIASQGYPFPSPTGIVDYDLRRVGERRVVSPVLTYGPFDALGLELDAQLPIVPGRFGIAAGAEIYRGGFEWGTNNRSHAFAIMPRWTPAPGVELRPFFSRTQFSDEEPQPLMLTRDGLLPPKIERQRYYGQPWAQSEGTTDTYGFIGVASPGAWTVRLGLFESAFMPRAQFADLYTDIDEARQANETIVAFQDSRFASRSGELRVSRAFDVGSLRHTFFVSARGRVQQRRYGGEDVLDLGAVELGVGRVVAQPEFDFGAQSHDEVKQHTTGLSYQLQWKDRGEMSVGLQKTSYRKISETPGQPIVESEAHPLLKNATATLFAARRLDLYASYTQGLEESPVAPNNAVNRNVAAPALLTSQYDAGFRYTFTKNAKLIIGVFDVTKPYFDLDANGFFRELGDVRHRGVEVSLAGSPFEKLTLVAGARFLDAQVSGPLVDAGVVGATPVAAYRTHAVGSVNYEIGATGFSMDAAFESVSRQTASSQNTVQVPGRAVVHIGGRYRFAAFGKSMTVRAQVLNVFDRYGWSVIGGGAYVYNSPRRIAMYLAADL
jgi:iron complex outermembrane receptor protein